MSYNESLKTISFPASADMSANQYEFVDVNSSGEIAAVTAKGAKAIGVLQDKPSVAGRVGSVGVEGITKVAVGAAVTAGVEVICDTTSRAIAKDDERQFVLGTALETATAAGNIIAIKLKAYQAASNPA